MNHQPNSLSIYFVQSKHLEFMLHTNNGRKIYLNGTIRRIHEPLKLNIWYFIEVNWSTNRASQFLINL
ncbi:hypothetical protein WICMUC_005048 [Wickerhamomyces mucosus]|uniref:Uncharacterized protein n=1 Tax=Wickerhamomyces mucosus TaxID=1378264 RepID=A0A9P8PDD0_9ASCO|nr:hypothetical protein WICMUC_005048 [Wickerhamomyces mucosus]